MFTSSTTQAVMRDPLQGPWVPGGGASVSLGAAFGVLAPADSSLAPFVPSLYQSLLPSPLLYPLSIIFEPN